MLYHTPPSGSKKYEREAVRYSHDKSICFLSQKERFSAIMLLGKLGTSFLALSYQGVVKDTLSAD